MGLSASQTRFLSLTARKSDLEFQAQTINTRRMELAQKSSDVARAYSSGMANQVIKVGSYENDMKVWNDLTYANLVEQGFQLIGANGASLNPSPYTEYVSGSIINSMSYDGLTEGQKMNCTKNDDGTYTVKNTMRLDAKTNFNGMDIQTLLMSGQGQIVSQPFFNYLCQHGYGTGYYYDVDADDNKTEISYSDLLQRWQNNEDDCNESRVNATIDWRSDTTSTFKQANYTNDDAQVNADYESATAEIQAQDKKLELELKHIETEHKAIETEMESVKKVIDKNIENSFKTFG